MSVLGSFQYFAIFTIETGPPANNGQKAATPGLAERSERALKRREGRGVFNVCVLNFRTCLSRAFLQIAMYIINWLLHLLMLFFQSFEMLLDPDGQS